MAATGPGVDGPESGDTDEEADSVADFIASAPANISAPDAKEPHPLEHLGIVAERFRMERFLASWVA